MLKKVVLMITSLCMVQGLCGMDTPLQLGTLRKKPTNYYLELGGERIPVSHKVIECSRILTDMEHKQEMLAREKRETDTEIKMIFSVDGYIAGAKKFIKTDKEMYDALVSLTLYTDGALEFKKLKGTALLPMLIVADALVVTKSDEEHFSPPSDIVEQLIQELKHRITTSDGTSFDHELLFHFLNKKGLLWTMSETLPRSLCDRVMHEIRLYAGDFFRLNRKGATANVLCEGKGGILFGGMKNGTIQVWDFKESRDNIKILQSNVFCINGLIELASGDLIACSNTMTKWSIGENYEKSVLLNAESSLKSFMLLDDNLLVAQSSDSLIVIFDLQKNESDTMKLDTYSLKCMAPIGSGKILGISQYAELIVIDVTQKECKRIGWLMSNENQKNKLAEPRIRKVTNDKFLVLLSDDNSVFVTLKGMHAHVEKGPHFGEIGVIFEVTPQGEILYGSSAGVAVLNPFHKNKQAPVLWKPQDSRDIASLMGLRDGRVVVGIEDDGDIVILSGEQLTFEQYVFYNAICLVKPDLHPMVQNNQQKLGDDDSKLIVKWAQELVVEPIKQAVDKAKKKQWYRDIFFKDDTRLNLMGFLPANILRNIRDMKGKDVIVIATECLCNALEKKLQDVTGLEQEAVNIEERLSQISTFLFVLEAQKNDKLMIKYRTFALKTQELLKKKEIKK